MVIEGIYAELLLKNIQSNVFRNGFCPYQNPLIQVIHLFIIRDKIPYELITDVFLSKFVCTNAVQYIIL